MASSQDFMVATLNDNNRRGGRATQSFALECWLCKIGAASAVRHVLQLICPTGSSRATIRRCVARPRQKRLDAETEFACQFNDKST
jgi:hypothetical protein